MTFRRLLIVAIAMLSASTAFAQGRPFVFEGVELEGEVQKPQVQIFITRQNLNKDYELELKESFIPKIIESVEKKPF